MRSTGIVGRTAMEFAISFNIPDDDVPPSDTIRGFGRMPHTHIVGIILGRLVDAGIIMRQSDRGGMYDRYLYLNRMNSEQHELNQKIVDFIVYGFPYVMEAYGQSAFQIVVHTDGIQESGTAFTLSPDCIITAAHCLRGKRNIQIIGFKKNDLGGSRIFLSRRQEVDCAMIVLPAPMLEGRQMPILMGAADSRRGNINWISEYSDAIERKDSRESECFDNITR